MPTTPRKTRAGLVLAIAAFLPGCLIVDVLDTDDDNVGNTRFEASETFQHEIPAADRSRLRVEGVSGEIVVIGSATATAIRITGERVVGSESTADAQRHLDELNVRVSSTSSTVRVWTDQPSNTLGRRYEVDYEITVPAAFRVTVSNTNGEVRIDEIVGHVEVDNVNGIVRLSDLACNVRVDLVNGRIDAALTVPTDASIDLGTVNGGIELGLPRDVSAELIAEVVNGSISLSGLTLEDQTTTARSLRGTFGAGEGMLELSTVNGNIAIRGN